MTAAPAETGSVPIVRGRGKCGENNRLNQESCTHLLLATADHNVGTAFFSKSDTMRWQLRLPAHSCDFESHNHILDRKGEHLWKN